MNESQVSVALTTVSTAAARTWAAPIAAACARYEVTTPERMAAFLAQIAHESCGFRRLEESFAYSAERLVAVFPSRVTEREAVALVANGREAIANAVYRGVNGNREAGDGWLYRGRGLIQLTGRANYRDAGEAIGIDLERYPERAGEADTAATIAAWFWDSRGCNLLADANAFTTITRRINGGTNGLGDRKAYWRRFRRAFGLPEQPESERAAPARGHEAASETPPKNTGRRIAAGVAGGAGGVTVLDQVSPYLPYLDDATRLLRDHWQLLVVAAILGGIAAVAVYGYRWWQSWKREA